MKVQGQTSVGTWNTGDQFFSDVTSAHGTGKFSLRYFTGESASSRRFHFSRRRSCRTEFCACANHIEK